MLCEEFPGELDIICVHLNLFSFSSLVLSYLFHLIATLECCGGIVELVQKFVAVKSDNHEMKTKIFKGLYSP